jgi:hypothetical protein
MRTRVSTRRKKQLARSSTPTPQSVHGWAARIVELGRIGALAMVESDPDHDAIVEAGELLRQLLGDRR